MSTMLASNINAQNIKINVNPVHISGIMPGIFGIQLENKLNVSNSIGLAADYYYLEPNFSGDGEYSGIRAKIAYRRYISNTIAYKGLFISPSVNYLHTDIPEVDEPVVELKSGNKDGIGIGLRIGTQFIVGKNISLGFALGPVYYKSLTKEEFNDSSSHQYWSNNMELNLEFSFGWIIK